MLSPAKINHALQINSHSKGQGENKVSVHGRSTPKALWFDSINVKAGNFRVLIKILSWQEVNGKELIKKKAAMGSAVHPCMKPLLNWPHSGTYSELKEVTL